MNPYTSPMPASALLHPELYTLIRTVSSSGCTPSSVTSSSGSTAGPPPARRPTALPIAAAMRIRLLAFPDGLATAASAFAAAAPILRRLRMGPPLAATFPLVGESRIPVSVPFDFSASSAAADGRPRTGSRSSSRLSCAVSHACGCYTTQYSISVQGRGRRACT